MMPTVTYNPQLPKTNNVIWTQTVVDKAKRGLLTAGANGKPETWNEAVLGPWSTMQNEAQIYAATGAWSPAANLALYAWAQQIPAGSADYQWAVDQVHGQRPDPSPTDWTPTAAEVQAAAQARAQDFSEAKTAIDLAARQAASRPLASGGLTINSAFANQMQAANNQSGEPMTAYQQAMVDLQNRQLSQQGSQFARTLAQQQQSEADARALNRAQVVARLQSDPGDAVARDYFLHSMGEPLGTPTDVFSGKVSSGPQMTLSDLLHENAVAVGAQPGPLSQGVSAMAHGSHGWVPMDKAIVGDEQRPGVPNPELIEVKAKGNRVMGRVTPLNEMPMTMSQMMRMPRHANGTYIPGELMPADTTVPNPNPYPDYQDTTTYAQLGAAQGMTKDPVSGNWVNKQGQVEYGYLNGAGELVGKTDLTGAQVSQGITQGWNPVAPNYQAPALPMDAPPGVTVKPNTGLTSRGTVAGLATDTAANSTPITSTLPPVKDPLTGLTMTAPNDAGFQRVVGGAPITAKVGAGGSISLAGDGTEIKGPDGSYYRWNSVTSRYEPIMVVPTLITSEQQFRSLDPQVQQAILAGKDKSFMLLDAGTGSDINGILTVVDSALKAQGIDPASMTGAQKVAYFNENRGSLDTSGIVRPQPAGWVGPMLNPKQLTFPDHLTASQFLALSPQEQLIAQDQAPGMPYSLSQGSVNSYHWDPVVQRMVPDGFVLGPQETGVQPFNYSQFWPNGELSYGMSQLLFGGQ